MFAGLYAAIDDFFRALLRRLVQAVGLTIAASAVGLIGAYFALRPTIPADADLWTYNREPAVTFLDAQGEVIGARGGLHTERISLADMPDSLKQAFLITEDRRFYDHGAIDWLGVLRAFVTNTVEGEVVQGGSTITQQLAKNVFLSRERTIPRKVKELILARQLEKRLSKDEILELYLNRIYLGNGAYGVEAAAQLYFDKSAKKVTLSEAAMLAGLAKAPSAYAPTTDLTRAQDRSKIVLAAMRDVGYIDEATYNTMAQNPAELAATAVSGEINYFLDFASWQLKSLLGEIPAEGDLIVTTTLDQTIQRKGERAVQALMEEKSSDRKADQAALVAIATDGAVRAMVGGRSYRKSQFNRAAQAMRQPGSAFKPFVFLAGLERGMSPNTRYYDAPVTIGDWTPENYTGRYLGPVSLTKALAESLNTVSARVVRDVGAKNVAATAKRLGISSQLKTDGTIALGTSEVTLLELTSAYVPFATTGLAGPRHAVTKIETDGGGTLYRYRAPARERLIKRSDAMNMNYMMYQVVQDGTGKRARLEGRPAAGKTGTSQKSRDAWFVGYTADMVAGVWVGNDDSTPTDRVTGGQLPAEIWQAFMTDVHEGWAVAELPGAKDPVRVASASVKPTEMRRFLQDLSRQFASNGGTDRAASKPKKKKRRFCFFCD